MPEQPCAPRRWNNVKAGVELLDWSPTSDPADGQAEEVDSTSDDVNPVFVLARSSLTAGDVWSVRRRVFDSVPGWGSYTEEQVDGAQDQASAQETFERIVDGTAR